MRLDHELRRRANMDVLAMLEADENGWVDALLRDMGRVPLMDERHSGVYAPRRSELTAAEVRVVAAMSHGLTTEMSADLLGVAMETVKTQLKAARLRLRGKNTTHAVANALRLGLIE